MIGALLHDAVMTSGGLATAGLVQMLAGAMAVRHFTTGAHRVGGRPPITVLKPLHGNEPLLEAALTSFCAQDYPVFQIVFGVGEASDAALDVVGRLRDKFPAVDMAVVVNPARHGRNLKIGNLINMLPAARYETLVISDSDIHAAPDYLSRIADAFSLPGTGLVTTLYSGLAATRSLADQLGAAYINQIFAPGALLARVLGRQDCLGATMALTRTTLERIGGFPALVNFVADDAVLGRKVRGLGLRVGLAHTVPGTTVGERDLATLFHHELRWARTIKVVAPLGFWLSVLQYPVFWGMLCALLSGLQPASLAFASLCACMRGFAGRVVEARFGAAPTSFWLPGIRDALSILVVAAALRGSKVAWRGHMMSLRDDSVYSGASPRLAPGEG